MNKEMKSLLQRAEEGLMMNDHEELRVVQKELKRKL